MDITCIIVDDEANNIAHLSTILSEQFPFMRVVATAHTVASAYEAIQRLQPDLLLLDIQLSGETAFDLLKKFNRLDVEIIFITAYDQYGIQAIKFSALDYLLKPVRLEELQAAIDKARDRISKKQKDNNLNNLLQFLQTSRKDQQKIALPLQNEIRYVPVGTICRCEASDNYTHIYLDTGEHLLVSRTLKEFALLLKSYDFVRTHQSHLVNLHFVKSYLKEDGGMLYLKDKTKIPISRTHREQVRKQLQQQME
jgi:two-component system, LytTR family, response regulator